MAGLGLFIACQPFWFDEKGGRAARNPDWDRDLFAGAKVLYRTEADRPPRRVESDVKLGLDESSEAWLAFKEQLRRFGLDPTPLGHQDRPGDPPKLPEE